ncbi:hypothetical protein [Leisingera sp. F5]|uniref:hypothetical protein n=1 Tax=Leisingera sp. F5 TaxID=1813816 RepID=UPI000B2A231A|nr:hypothetical protein [Leisingera sp. F5]
MAMVFPLPRAEFLNLLRVQEVRFQLDLQRQITGLAGGEILSAEVAPPLWRGAVSLAPMKKRTAAEVQALMAMLEAPGRSFEAYKAQQVGPAADPQGAALTGFAPQLAEVHSADPARIKLNQLPPSYELSAGDFLAFSYDNGSGARRALHQVVQGRAADATGATASYLTVTPALRAGATAGAAVDLLRPHCLAVLVPGSVSYGITRGNTTSGMGFEFRQTLRG